MRRLILLSALLAGTGPEAPAAQEPDPAATAKVADALLAEENAGRAVRPAPPLDDLPFLRRLSLDLTGRIPTEADIRQYLARPADRRRALAADEFMARDQFADRWAVFLGDVLRVRATADGGAALQAYVHEAVRQNVPYDVLARRLIAAAGKANAQPETGFVLNDEADPMALTGVVSQVFLGVRISCAQCHDHPFDSWSREEFYNLAAFFGKTRRIEHRVKMQVLGVYLSEEAGTRVLWPPEDKAQGKPRSPVTAAFPFKLDAGDGPAKHLARLAALRAAREAEAKARLTGKDTVDALLEAGAKKADGPGPDDVTAEAQAAARRLDIEGDKYRASVLRKELAEVVTDPRNRYFSRTIVNRVWAELVGRGFVNPVDDFRDDNPPSHPKTLDFLADEFVASGYDLRFLVRAIVRTDAYRRGHLPGTVPAADRLAAEAAFAAAPPRRMPGEALFDSIVQAGHLFAVKHRPGENVTTVTQYVQVVAAVKDDGSKGPPPAGGAMAGVPKPAATGVYDLERGIEVDFKDALKKKDGLDVDKMAARPAEEIEAEAMMRAGAMPGKRVRYTTKEVTAIVDDNPKFTSAARMAAPAPPGHFLRVFGQTDRATLDERRDHGPSMRQALMMLNGKLTNEAARVGPLEPVYALLTGDKPDVDKAVSLVYREALTREPTADELADAKEIFKAAGGPLPGMADLRWALFNSNEFRFVP